LTVNFHGDKTNVLIHELQAYGKNSRTHSDAQINQIVNSIKEFGFTNPVLINDKKEIIAGHGRVDAAKKLGLDSVPCVVLTGLTDAQKRAYIIADNRLALSADWNYDLLKDELDALKTDDFDLELLGFSDDELNDLLDPEVEFVPQSDEDDVPEIPEEPKTKLGDIWILGKHRLMCGDSTSIDAVDKLMDGKKADMVFTDPLYNDEASGFIAVIKILQVEHILLMTTFKQAISILNDSGFAFKFDCVLYFKTPSSMMNKKVPYYLHKNIFYLTSNDCVDSIFSCDNAKGVFSDNGYYPSVIEAKKNTKEEHGLTKPVDSIVKILSGFKAESIIDLFGGSGTTLIACEKTKRICYMMELDPKYCDVIVNRWQNYTGEKAYLESTGEKFGE
jgi:hypothetical protein